MTAAIRIWAPPPSAARRSHVEVAAGERTQVVTVEAPWPAAPAHVARRLIDAGADPRAEVRVICGERTGFAWTLKGLART